MVKISSGLISRIPGGDRVTVKVGVVQMERVNGEIYVRVGMFKEMSPKCDRYIGNYR